MTMTIDLCRLRIDSKWLAGYPQSPAQQMKGNTMEDYKNYYNKKNVQPLRPYVPGEDMSGIYVNPVDTVEEGGMIAHLPNNPVAKWYITREFFEANYVEAEQAA